MRRTIAYLAAAVLIAGCGGSETDKHPHDIEGLWTLARVAYPTGETIKLPNVVGGTELYIYDDSVLYNCGLRFLNDAVSITPDGKTTYRCIDRGTADLLYFEGGEKRPLRFQDDTTIVVQRFGVRFTMVRADSFLQSHTNDIKNVVRNDSSFAGGEAGRYVFSKTETELRHTNHTLLYTLAALAAAAAAIIWYATRTRRRNKQLRNKLRLIEEERLMRHEKVDKAMREVADDFFQSEYYANLSRRVASGKPLDDDEWAEIERKLVRVYPNFASHLTQLINMSDVEFRTCMLIKLRFAPKDMASALSKTRTGVSSIRSRLYKKVFQKSGSPADWDKFVLSL